MHLVASFTSSPRRRDLGRIPYRRKPRPPVLFSHVGLRRTVVINTDHAIRTQQLTGLGDPNRQVALSGAASTRARINLSPQWSSNHGVSHIDPGHSLLAPRPAARQLRFRFCFFLFFPSCSEAIIYIDQDFRDRPYNCGGYFVLGAPLFRVFLGHPPPPPPPHSLRRFAEEVLLFKDEMIAGSGWEGFPAPARPLILFFFFVAACV